MYNYKFMHIYMNTHTHVRTPMFLEVLVTNKSKRILIYKIWPFQESRKPNLFDLLSCQWKIDELCLLMLWAKVKVPLKRQEKRRSDL
jgi:hypothetical protein